MSERHGPRGGQGEAVVGRELRLGVATVIYPTEGTTTWAVGAGKCGTSRFVRNAGRDLHPRNMTGQVVNVYFSNSSAHCWCIPSGRLLIQSARNPRRGSRMNVKVKGNSQCQAH